MESCGESLSWFGLHRVSSSLLPGFTSLKPGEQVLGAAQAPSTVEPALLCLLGSGSPVTLTDKVVLTFGYSFLGRDDPS